MEIGTRSGAGLCGWLIGRMETLHTLAGRVERMETLHTLVGWVTLLLIVWTNEKTPHTGRMGIAAVDCLDE